MTTTKVDTPSGRVAALVVATSRGADPVQRDLLCRPVLGRPLIAWTLRALAQFSRLDECALFIPRPQRDVGEQALHEALPSHPVMCRSIDDVPWTYALNILFHDADRSWSPQWYIVVDAALPLLSAEGLNAGLRAAARTGAAIAGEPVKETLKRVDSRAVVETLPRERLRRLCSPAIFHASSLEHVIQWFPRMKSPDDLISVALAVQEDDLHIAVFDAGYPCVRVTSEHDLSIVESLLRQREMESWPQ